MLLTVIGVWDLRNYFISADCNFIRLKNKPCYVDKSNRPNEAYIELAQSRTVHELTPLV
jgi:hypothetical protein